jgi:hypothetical protein
MRCGRASADDAVNPPFRPGRGRVHVARAIDRLDLEAVLPRFSFPSFIGEVQGTNGPRGGRSSAYRRDGAA